MRNVGREIVMLGLAAALAGCAASDAQTQYKYAESSVNSALAVIRGWQRGDMPDQFAANAVDGEIRFLSSLMPKLDGAAEVPIVPLQQVKKAIEASDHPSVDKVVPGIASAVQSLHAAAG